MRFSSALQINGGTTAGNTQGTIVAKISFHHPHGLLDVLDVEPGTSVMRAAVNNGVAGIVGECGGQAMCATCHVYVREDYLAVLPSISEDEDEMLDCTVEERTERSRLGCQLTVGGALEELEVDVPESQN
jgi:ferredoxin, 2Fe-2S